MGPNRLEFRSGGILSVAFGLGARVVLIVGTLLGVSLPVRHGSGAVESAEGRKWTETGCYETVP